MKAQTGLELYFTLSFRRLVDIGLFQPRYLVGLTLLYSRDVREEPTDQPLVPLIRGETSPQPLLMGTGT